MRKIWNTLIYGDRRTKAYLWSIVVLILLSIASCVVFMVTFSPWWILGIPGGLIGAAVVASMVKFREVDGEENADLLFSELLNAKKNETMQKRISAEEKVAEKQEGLEEKRVGVNKRDDMQEVPDTEETKEENDKYLKALQKRQIKKLLYKYKVKRVHYPVLIEECESRKISQCPAYVWVNKGRLQVMALSAKTRAFEIPLSKLQTILAERAVKATPKEEYAAVKEAKYVAKVFDGLIPSYYIMADENGRRSYRKNRYRVGADFVVTDKSARALMELTQAGFVLPEEEKMARAYGTYAAEAYKLKFLCQDGVILPEEYKIKIRILLQQMVEAEISDYEFSKNLSLMVKKQLITEEYAKYYQDARLGRQ